ncbi:MAG: Ig-like domain-containing protein [Ignavibacteriales bacterium]|nr:Ig-like domain-containing protein [Ignavibacteriales bacterium]
MMTWKRISVGAVVVLLLGIFSCEDPNAAGSDFTVTVSGRVENKAQSGQDSVVITLSKPFRRDTTKSDGSFSYSFVSTEKNAVDATLSFRHINLAFFDTSFSIQYSSTSKTVDLGVVEMKAVNPANDSVVTGRPSLRPGVIVFKSASLQTISIRGAGSNDATNLTFEVKDSLGTAVDDLNKTTVFFSLVNKPDILVELNRSSAVTNASGQVTVQLTAGSRSGLAQVQAYALVKRTSDTTQTDTIRSPIISISIAGGLPVASRFTIGSQRVNVPGLVKFNLRNTITAVVGDTFGNPVQKGTVIYFKTNGGIIQPTATTSEDGTIGVDLITGNPIPPNGIATITAEVGTSGGGGVISKPGPDVVMTKAVDENILVKGLRSKQQQSKQTRRVDKQLAKQMNIDQPLTSSSGSVFTRTLNILFSGAPRITSNDSVFVVPTLGSKQINFTVADENGNPLSQGTTIKVSGIGTDTSGAVLSGDLDKNLPDTYDRSFTQFSINVSDRRSKNLNSTVPIKLTVEVTGDNGNIKKTFQGYLTSAVSDSGKVGSISLTNSAIDSIRVAGVGAPNSAIVGVKVLTADGQPSPGIPINFAIVKTVEGGEYLSSTDGVTDNSGIAQTTLFGGVKAGLVKVQASISKDSLSVASQPKSIYIRTGSLSSIAIISVEKNEISVQGVGGDENTTVIYEARDLLGNPLDISNQTMLNFKLVGVTGFDERVKPDSSLTNPFTGRVNVNVTGGTRSTVLQVIAQNASKTVKSSPVPIVVHGGFAVESLFVFKNAPKNISIYDRNETAINMQVGDRYGNPVKSGTAVYFETNAGIIGASGFTDNSGNVQTRFTAIKSDSYLGGRYIKASTVGLKSGNTDSIVSSQLNILMSGAPAVTAVNVPTDTVLLFDGTSTTIQYRIQDVLGNPISGGHNYQVFLEGSVASQLLVQGDVAGVVPDTDDKVNGTQYTKCRYRRGF